MNQRIFLLLLTLMSLLTWGACNSDNTTAPKPRGFPRVIYPKKTYQSYNGNCGFSFEYPQYAQIQKDSNRADMHNCWFNIYFKDFDARLHCSYYPINAKSPFSKLMTDAFDLADKHDMRADYIDELPFNNAAKDVNGFVFNIEGPAASPFQFYLTDSTQNFFRGALYFNTQARPDSLAPVLEFLKTDVMQMLNTFEWKNK